MFVLAMVLRSSQLGQTAVRRSHPHWCDTGTTRDMMANPSSPMASTASVHDESTELDDVREKLASRERIEMRVLQAPELNLKRLSHARPTPLQNIMVFHTAVGERAGAICC